MDAVPGKFYGVWSGLLYAWIVAGAVGSVMILEADLHGECFRQLDMAAGTVFHTFSGCLTDALAGFLLDDDCLKIGVAMQYTLTRKLLKK